MITASVTGGAGVCAATCLCVGNAETEFPKDFPPHPHHFLKTSVECATQSSLFQLLSFCLGL
jgi:hypothetical protein